MLRLALLAAAVALSGCTCGPPPGPDAGPDSGTEGEGEGDGEGEGEGDLDGGPQCNESTTGFGTQCGDCGTFVCNPITDQLVCNDPGFNDCGVCGDLDESAGRVGATCGVEGCGIGQCNADNTATECQGGEILRNDCGGCTPLDPDTHPGDTCSGCNTGVQTCTSDQNSLVCFRGREPDNVCATEGAEPCARCVRFHADMVDHVTNGGFLNPGTVAIIEDVGGGAGLKLSFDPFIGGPGACCLPDGQVFLSSDPNPIQGASFPLFPEFSSTLNFVLSDPVRTYDIDSFDAQEILSVYRYVVLADESGLFGNDPVLSVGEIVAGPPG